MGINSVEGRDIPSAWFFEWITWTNNRFVKIYLFCARHADCHRIDTIQSINTSNTGYQQGSLRPRFAWAKKICCLFYKKSSKTILTTRKKRNLSFCVVAWSCTRVFVIRRIWASFLKIYKPSGLCDLYWDIQHGSWAWNFFVRDGAWRDDNVVPCLTRVFGRNNCRCWSALYGFIRVSIYLQVAEKTGLIL